MFCALLVRIDANEEVHTRRGARGRVLVRSGAGKREGWERELSLAQLEGVSVKGSASE